MKITAITLKRDGKLTAYCDTGAFREGKCQLTIERREDCPNGKDICCLVCDLVDSGCDTLCDRINPDE